MTIKREQRKVERSPEEQARIDAIREKYQQDKPGPDQVAASGEYEGPVQACAYWEVRRVMAELKAKRERQGLTLAQLAKRSGIDKGAISKLETGRQVNPTVDTLNRIAAGLGIRIELTLQAEGGKGSEQAARNDPPAQLAAPQDGRGTTGDAPNTDESARQSTIDWLRVNDDAIAQIHAQLGHLAKIGLEIRQLVDGWETPTREQLRNLIEVAFWASLRTNEGRPTRVHVTIAARTMIPDAVPLATPVEYDEIQVAKLAHVVPAGGCLALSAFEGTLKVWGLARSLPGNWIDTVVVEISGPGIVRVTLGPLQPFAVFHARSASMIEGSRISFAAHLQRILRKELPVTDILETQAVWRECLVLAHLVRMIVDEGHGGTVLIVPAEEGGWLDSLDPFAFRFAKPDSSIRNWIRRELTGGMARATTIGHVLQTKLSDDDKNIVIGGLAQGTGINFDILRPIASLAGCDGAIVMTRDLQVVGFGAKIRTRSEAATQVCMFGPHPGHQLVVSSPLEHLGGTRHQSAARFISVHKDSAAVVISQDRHMSVMHWDPSHERVFVVRNADWWV
jgi:transcriptional regulator with XRE-family HTH domain